ncbi:MAG TPA: hypothetical protein VN841_08520 [Bryobacteraceae bacterium]|nr:hypothetical protein [Bryobacteraceae bacterium]
MNLAAILVALPGGAGREGKHAPLERVGEDRFVQGPGADLRGVLRLYAWLAEPEGARK